MTLRPLFYSDQDCRDRLKPGKPMFFNVYLFWSGSFHVGSAHPCRSAADRVAFTSDQSRTPYRIVVKAKPTTSPEKEDAA